MQKETFYPFMTSIILTKPIFKKSTIVRQHIVKSSYTELYENMINCLVADTVNVSVKNAKILVTSLYFKFICHRHRLNISKVIFKLFSTDKCSMFLHQNVRFHTTEKCNINSNLIKLHKKKKKTESKIK